MNCERVDIKLLWVGLLLFIYPLINSFQEKCTWQRGQQGMLPPLWLSWTIQTGQLPPSFLPCTVQISQQLPKEHHGPDPRVPIHTVAPVRKREWDRSSHLWPSLTAEDWRGELAQKSHRRKINMPKGLCLPRDIPFPCHPHTQWSESQYAVSLRLGAQMRLSDDYYLHKSSRQQLRLKVEIEFNIHSQQFPECCLSDLQYIRHKVEVSEF